MKPIKLLAGTAILALTGSFGIASAAEPSGAERFESAPPGQVDSAFVPSSMSSASVRVIVELTAAPVAVEQARSDTKLTGQQKAAIRSNLKSQQKPVVDKAEALGGTVLADMQDAYNGVKVEIAGSDVAALAEVAGVKAVHSVEIHERSNATSGVYLGVPAVWESTGLTGKGVKVAILDTGVDYTHAMFGGPGTVAAYEAADATDTAPADPTLFGPDAVRVKGGYDLVGDEYNASSDDPARQVPQPDANPLDCQGHGSHVAGTSAGGGVTADGAAYTGPYDTSAESTDWKIGPGIAPEADIYAYRVFGCEGSTDVTVEAIDMAVADGVDVINMSLGSPYGTADDPSAVASSNAVAAGVVVVASAGNAGPEPYVTGSPGTGKGVVSVAANDSTATFPGVEITLPDGGAVPAINANGIDPVPTGPYTVVHLQDVAGTPENEALGCSTEAYTANGIVPGGNQMAVSVRGTCARVARAIYAQQAGATAAAMINTSADFPPFEGAITSNPDTGEAYEVTIPFLGVRGLLGAAPTDDGDRLVAAAGQEVTTARADLDNPGFSKFASFSSGGPRTGDSGIKANVTAPGVSIRSAAVGTGADAAIMSGTSMAAPQVAGVAALNVEAHPDWSAESLSANLVNTADPDKVGDYRLTLGGAGLVDVAQSVANTVTAVSDSFETAHGTLQEPGLGFGFAESTSTWTGTKTVTLTNHGTSAQTYAVSSAPSPQSVPSTVSFDTTSVTVQAGGTATVDVTLTVDMSQVGTALTSTMYEASGTVVLSGDGELRVPYLAIPRAEASVDAKLKGTLNPKAVGKKNSPMSVPVELTNRGGAIATAADVYTLGLTDAEGDVALAGHPGTDLRALGVQSFPVGDDQLLVFAVNTWDRYSNAARNQTEVLVDVDNDGVVDWSVFATDSGTVRSGSVNGVNETFLWNAHTGGLYGSGFLASSPTDNSTVLLPVFASDLGVTAESGTLGYGGYVSSLLDSAAADSFDGMALYDPWNPALTNGQYAELEPGNVKHEVTVDIDREAFAAQQPGGVMVVALDNRAGAAEAVLLLAR